jgi:hypothetical protein
MTMPGGENIAISIKTSADTSGLQTARTEVGALATETKAATDAMAQASTEAAAVGATLANAAAKSVTDTSKMAASAEQVALAWERAGGVASENFERFRTELGAIVNAQAAAGSAATESASATLAGAEAAETSTTAVDALAVAEVKATSATKALAVAEQQSAVATLAGATASKQRGAALAEEAGKIEKIPGSAKTAANAVGLLSQAALTGQGSIAGMAAAAGNLASGLATVTKSAQLAAGAAGIGAIISLGAAAYGIYHSYSEESRHLAERLGDVQSETRGLNAAINGNELGQRLEQIRQAGDSEIRQIKEIHFHTQAKNDLIAAILEKEERSAALARDDNARSVARETASLEAAAADSAEARYRAQAKIIELDRQDQNRRGVQGADSAAAQRLVNVAQAGEDAIFAAHNQAGALIGQLEGQYESHRRTIQADYATELHSLDQMTLAEGQRAQLVDSYNAKRQYGLQLLDREQRMQRADLTIEAYGLSSDPNDQQHAQELEIEKERQQRNLDFPKLEEENNRNAQLKIAALRRATLEEGIAGYARLADASKKYGNFAAAAAQSVADAVRRFEILVQARKDAIKAKSEFAAGLASLGSHDFWGATQHFAASTGFAAAAAAGGIEAAQSSGGGGGGGGGSGSDAGYAGGSSFTPQQQGGGQTVVVNLLIGKLTTEEDIEEISWTLQRNGVLNKPINAPRKITTAATVTSFGAGGYTTTRGPYG